MSELRTQIKSIKPTIPSDNASLLSLEKRLSALETAITETPSKALAIPLLRKDLDEMSKRDIEYRAAIRTEIDRLYDQQKWILGSIGTVLLAVAGGAISILLRTALRQKDATED